MKIMNNENAEKDNKPTATTSVRTDKTEESETMTVGELMAFFASGQRTFPTREEIAASRLAKVH